MFNPRLPYNDLPPLPPSVDLETKRILRKVITASRALARLNGALRNLPNPTLFLDTIHLHEAKASSEIENIITTNDELFRDLVSEKELGNPSTKEVLRYKQALWIGFQRIQEKPFVTTNLSIEIVQRIKQNSAGIRVTPGTALANPMGDVLYTPPEGENVIRDKMSSLEQFINGTDDMDPLVKMALLHYQFEAIHPFTDGNGRTGRILMLLYLKLSGLLDIPAIYLSDYIIKRKPEYYLLLRGVTENEEWERYVLYMLDMVETTATKALHLIEEVGTLMESMSEQIKRHAPKAFSKDLIEILFRLPYTKRQILVDAGIGSSKTVGNYLLDLESKGFLTSERVGKEKIFINVALSELLSKQ